MTYSATTKNEEETLRFITPLAEKLAGRVCFLSGPLGAGKTAFVRCLAMALGSTDAVTSPTFTLEQRYCLAGGRTLRHFDVYRLETFDENTLALMKEAFESGDTVCVEWAGRLPITPEKKILSHIEARLTPTGHFFTIGL